MVGVTGFEPAAPCSQSTCATKLRHTPEMEAVPHKQQTDYSIGTLKLSSPRRVILRKRRAGGPFARARRGRRGAWSRGVSRRPGGAAGVAGGTPHGIRIDRKTAGLPKNWL